MKEFSRFSLFVVNVITVLSLLISCTKEFPRRIAVLTLPIESDIAMAKGQIIDLGETGISDHGFVYDSNASIPANAQRVTLGSSVQTKTFEATLTNLRPHTRYYVNAFLTNRSETTYGDPVSFLTAMNFPEVKTESLANITDSTATCNGEVTQDGGSIVFARGVCWSFTSQPTLLNDHTIDGTGTGKFAGSLIHLKKDSTYFVRAYASNNAGTSYGNELSFKAGQSQTSPIVTTADISSISQTTAISGGNVTSDGGVSVTARGVCWSTNPYPTIADSKTSDGSGIGQFVSSVAGLTANTTYYLRAYATNTIGTSYGDEKTFQTTSNPVLPTVTTASITNITTTTAQSGGTVLESGGLTVTERGVCWSTSSNPTTANNHTSDGSGMGSFTSSVTGLTSNTKYYLRAYATNGVGTAYGNEISFTAGQSVTTPTVTTTNVTNIAQTTATCGGNVTSDGGATVTARGVCWSTSTNPTTTSNHTTDGSGIGGYLSSLTGLTANTSYFVRAYATNSAGTSYANQKSFTTLPEVTSPSVTTAPATNITNSTATSGGTVTNDGGANVTARGVCWSTGVNPTITDSHTNNGTGTGSFISQITGLLPNTFYRVRAYATNSAGTAYGNQQTFSTLVNPVLPTVSTAQTLNITTTTATSGGTVNSDGGSPVTTRGVCWSTSSNPTTASSHTTDGSGIGTFVSNLTGLTPNTVYYVRAYATNGVGTAYGNEVTFITQSSFVCGQIITYEGKNYNTVQIGTQCWFKDNLNIGIRINAGQGSGDNGVIEKYCYSDNESNCDVYGGMYQWNEMMQYVTTEGAQGICPSGWHIPSDNEWTILTTFLGGETSAGGKMKETGTIHWTPPNTGATNESGFTGLPGGWLNIAAFYYINNLGDWWSSTQFDSSNAWMRKLEYNSTNILKFSDHFYHGVSVRCVNN